MTGVQEMRHEFSANTGYLWKDLPFLDRIRRAAAHGFDAVEFHDEARTTDRGELREVLAQTGLPVAGLNVRMGPTLGCAAIPGQGDQARRDIDEAIGIAEDLGAAAIHVLAGVASGPDARAAYLTALRHALDRTELMILIEPVCAEQVPGYFLRTVEEAARVISDIGHPRLNILFDCYHVFRESGDVLGSFAAHAGLIGHVQIAAIERRAEPFPGEIDYGVVLPAMRARGYLGRFGAEYRPAGATEDGLSWRDGFSGRAGGGGIATPLTPART